MYTMFNGQRIYNDQITTEVLEHDAAAYGAIAVKYLNEKIQLPSEAERFAEIAGQWATEAAHCARMISRRARYPQEL